MYERYTNSIWSILAFQIWYRFINWGINLPHKLQQKQWNKKCNVVNFKIIPSLSQSNFNYSEKPGRNSPINHKPSTKSVSGAK